MAEATQTHELEQLLGTITQLKAQASTIQDQLTVALDKLSGLVEACEVDPTFSHNDWRFNWNPGRITYEYPQEVIEIELIYKRAKRNAEADGTAEPKNGLPFWTIRSPK